VGGKLPVASDKRFEDQAVSTKNSYIDVNHIVVSAGGRAYSISAKACRYVTCTRGLDADGFSLPADDSHDSIFLVPTAGMGSATW
jgi:hypothetical protein